MKWVNGVISGFLGGFLGGVAGVGGGVVMIPLMTWLQKLTQHQAHGTSLVAIAFSAAVGAATYFGRGDVNWKASLLMAATAVFTARLGARYAHSLPEKKLKKAFGIFLIFASVMLLVKSSLPAFGTNPSLWAAILLFLLIGAATGFLSGMMGVGGGAVMVPPMVIIGGMEQHLAQGTSLLAMVPAATAGAITHYKLGNVRTDIMWGLAIGSLAGGFTGASTAALLPEPVLRSIFAGIGLVMSIRYLRSR